jgi:hypothetical protein
MGGRRRDGSFRRALLALSLLATACAQGGGRGDAGPGGDPDDGSTRPRRDGGGSVEPCTPSGYPATCDEATDVGTLAVGDRIESDEGLIDRVGGAQWLRVSFPMESAATDGGVAPGAGGGTPAIRFLENPGEAYRLEIRTDCTAVATCGEGGGPATPGMGSNITEWSFTDTVRPGDEGPGALSTRDVPWPETVHVRVYAVAPTECGAYRLEITR